jgi:hypothetical protein
MYQSVLSQAMAPKTLLGHYGLPSTYHVIVARTVDFIAAF